MKSYYPIGFYHLLVWIALSHHGLTTVDAPEWPSTSCKLMIYSYTMYQVHHHLKILRTQNLSTLSSLISPVPISKKPFRPGGMATSEWTRSVRAVRDTPVAEYSAPSVNTTGRVAYRPPIAVSPFLLALSVCYIKQTLWHCGQL
jgi:hypothetical protein